MGVRSYRLLAVSGALNTPVDNTIVTSGKITRRDD